MMNNWVAIYTNIEKNSPTRTITIAAPNIVKAAQMASAQARANEVVTRLLKA